MKIIYLTGALLIGSATLGMPYYMQSSTHAASYYAQSGVIEKDHVEVVYLPNNTCHINTPIPMLAENYQNYVRACLNNRHLRQKINILPSN